MYSVELLIKEHKCILDFNRLIREICCRVIDGNDVDIKLMRECVDFGRSFADKHHHSKEEKVLFRIMLDELGSIADKIINGGMLIEHDLGRFHLSELEKAINRYDESHDRNAKLDVIMNASAYGSLLKRHIEKEDSVIFEYAKRSLNGNAKHKADVKTEEFEMNARKNGVPDKYLGWLYTKLKEFNLPAERKTLDF
ncbi:MAG: hemerythrin domain-containing protein [Oscillospiraceae bacterium]|nr:hemerythrin domain-containing protein [Oscillospiraceae bacterium]